MMDEHFNRNTHCYVLQFQVLRTFYGKGRVPSKLPLRHRECVLATESEARELHVISV